MLVMSILSQQLLCFQHCNKAYVFCFTLPINCPVCQKDLSNTDLRIPPFRIPIPLSSEVDKLSLLIKPTYGNFFSREFKRGDLLHIALSNSDKKIFEFDENGISTSSKASICSANLNWTNFLSVSLSTLSCEFEKLDKVLENTINMDIWAADRYDEVNNNCFDYVISVLNESNNDSYQSFTKLQLCEDVISPAINKTTGLLSILRNVFEKGFFLQDNIIEPIIITS